MPKCGNCKIENTTVEHVRSCYQGKYATATAEPVEVTGFAEAYVEVKQAEDFEPMAFSNLLTIPDSCYAVERSNGLIFVKITKGKGKWSTFTFVDRLFGAPGQWRKVPLKGEDRKKILAEVGFDAKASAILFSKHFTVCAVCSSPLSDPESMERGLGPICAERF